MDLRRIDSTPHDFKPALGRHHTEHGDHGVDHIIEVSLMIDPITTVVKTVPLRQNLLYSVVGQIRRITVVKGALEQAHSLNTEDHQD